MITIPDLTTKEAEGFFTKTHKMIFHPIVFFNEGYAYAQKVLFDQQTEKQPPVTPVEYCRCPSPILDRKRVGFYCLDCKKEIKVKIGEL